MSGKAGSNVLRQLRFVVASWKEDTRTDVELLRRFVQTRDEPAFTTLVGRHSELVWGVCLRILRNPADAEDALQATFLRLARDAKRIMNKEALAAWLFRAARDCAVDLQRSIVRQRRIEERAAAVAHQADAAASSDLRVLLDDELAQLSQSERAVLVLCCLEGRTYADAALELGCSTAAVHRRFVRAQTRLRRRFAQHGKAAAGVLATVLLGAAIPAASAAPPAALARTVEVGLAVARAGAMPATRAGAVAGAAVAAGVDRGAALALVAAVLVGCACAAVSALRDTPAPESPESPRSVVRVEPERAKPSAAVTGVVRGPDGAPLTGATVVALARRPFGPGERGLRDEVLAAATTDGGGRFALDVPDDFDTWFADRVVTVRASGAGFAPVTLPVRLKPTPAAVELKLPAASALRGALLDAAGRPAGGVRVEVVRIGHAVAEPVVGRAGRAPPAWPAAAATAADGSFEFPALGGVANVWVRAADPRFALDTFRVDGASGTFRLAPARPLTVEVRAADTGAALAEARVTVVTDRVAAHPHFCAADHAVLGPQAVPADIDAVTDAAGRVCLGLAAGDRAEVLVHPPAGAGAYVGVRARVEVTADPGGQLLIVRVPRGRWLTGTVTAGGRPVAGAAVHWGREDATLPEWKDDVLVGRDALSRTGPDGAFRLAVLPGACSVRVYGPTADFEHTSAKLPAATNTSTIFAHHIARVEIAERGDVPPLRVTLRPAAAVSGRVEHPAADSGATFLLASGRVSPVRGYAALPLPVRDGAFVVPGCRAGHTARAYLLDPVARVGCTIDVTPGVSVPTAKLVACGALRLRVLDSAGKPKAGQEVSVSLLADRDRAADATGERDADAQPVEWFDAVNYPARPRTGADGTLDLPALIPGARYAVSVGSGTSKFLVGKFAIDAGRTVAVPDVILPEGGK